ncbi:MAG: hypothetical protein FVQ80_00540 [Planctomycetes bacterium]|nr:hypothetical protein [Planctomycetota bacterium]
MLNVVTNSFCCSGNVCAYIDPNMGSLLLQLLFGGLAALFVVVKLYWRKVVSIFVKTKDEETGDSK